MRTKLTAALVRQYVEEQPPERELIIWDAAVPRFGLRVRPPKAPGAPWPAAYLVQWRAHDGRGGKQVVGAPATHKLDEAREAAKAVLRQVDAGHNPLAEKAAARAAWTVAEAAAAYLASPEFAKKTTKVRAGNAATFKHHIIPRLGREKLSEIDVPAVRRLLRAIEGDQRCNTRKRRLGGAGAARKGVRLLSAMLSWAVCEGRLAANPILGHLRLDGDGERSTILDRPEQYAALLETMDRMVAAYERERAALLSDPAARSRKFAPHRKDNDQEPVLPPAVRAFFVLAATTGLRRGELRELTWGQVDLTARRITLHTSKGAKLARKGPKQETVSLPPLAAATLATLCPEDPDPTELVFVPRSGKALEVTRHWAAVRAAAGLPPDLTLHGLRHSIGTAGILSGMSTAEVQKLLRHRNISVTQRYVHLAEQATGRLQDRAIAHLLPAAPDAPGGAAPVVPLRRRA